VLYPAAVTLSARRWLPLVVVLAASRATHGAEGPGSPDLDQLRHRYTGDYVFAGGTTERAGVPAAVERSVDGMFFIARGIAYDRLLKSSEICASYRFDLGGEKFSIAGSCRTPDVSPADGHEVDHRTRQGEDSKLSQRFVGETLVQEFRGDEGSRRVVWTLLPDGSTLRAQVEISSKHLPRPVDYTLTYRRRTSTAAAADGGP
jgi:hypothetical protein